MRVTLTATLFALSLPAAALAHDPSAATDIGGLPTIAEIAPDAVPISPHVPQMGVHYANPADLPTGPIWCVIEGRVVCVEYLFLASALAAGESWNTLSTGGVLAPITHVDVDYVPGGVGPFQEPLYQLHIWFANPAALADH